MSDLRVKPNQDNGDLPQKSDGQEKKNDPQERIIVELSDIFNPTVLREWFEKDNGQENKDKEKD